MSPEITAPALADSVAAISNSATHYVSEATNTCDVEIASIIWDNLYSMFFWLVIAILGCFIVSIVPKLAGMYYDYSLNKKKLNNEAIKSQSGKELEEKKIVDQIGKMIAEVKKLDGFDADITLSIGPNKFTIKTYSDKTKPSDKGVAESEKLVAGMSKASTEAVNATTEADKTPSAADENSK